MQPSHDNLWNVKYINMKNIEWKDIIGFEGHYQVSNIGTVRSLDRLVNSKNGSKRMVKGQIKSLNKIGSGYLKVSLRDEKVHLIHRVVAKHYIPNPNRFPQVNHKDGNKENNKAENLEWCDASRNQIHRVRVLGKKPVMNFLGDKGYKHPKSKTVLAFYSGEFIGEFGSAHEAAQKTCTGFSKVCAVARGELSATKGYVFKYK